MKTYGGDEKKGYPRKSENLHVYPSTTADDFEKPKTFIYLPVFLTLD